MIKPFKTKKPESFDSGFVPRMGPDNYRDEPARAIQKKAGSVIISGDKLLTG